MSTRSVHTPSTGPTQVPPATPAGAKPLVDVHGEPLLPRVADRIRRAQQAAEAAPSLAPGRTRSVLDAGERFPAVDPELLAAYEAEGRHLQAVATGEALGAFFQAIGHAARYMSRAVGRALSRAFSPAPSTEEVRRVLGPGYRGVLGINEDYFKMRGRYYGRGL